MWRATRTRRSARPSASGRGRRRRNCRGRAPGYGNRWRTSRESGSHDGRTVRAQAGGGSAGLPSPPGDAAGGDVAADRGDARGTAPPPVDARSRTALGCGHRGGVGARHRHWPLEHDRLPARRRDCAGSGARPYVGVRVSAGHGPVPHPHRGAAHGVPHREPRGREAAHRAVRGASPRPALHHASHARLAGGARRQAEEPARGPRARARPDRAASGDGRPGRPTIDQPGAGPAQRAAAATDGESRRFRLHARTRSPVMPGMSLLVASVVALQQQPVVVVPPMPPMPLVASVLEAVRVARAVASVVLPDVTSLQGLESLTHGEQDPTDSLWRAARQALNRADYQAAANLYGDLMRRYPNATRAGDALYWAAFALYKNDNLDHARSLLFTQQQRYSKAATRRDGETLLARVQAALAKQGDAEAAAWIAAHAQSTADTGARHGETCPGEDDDDDMRVAALKGCCRWTQLTRSPSSRRSWRAATP